MAENSSSPVTISLGRRDQVVKKAGPAVDSSFDDSQSAVGRKRSVRDRLGGIVDSKNPHDTKRLQVDGREMSVSAIDAVDDRGLSKNDLRYKIMRKNMQKKSQSNGQQSGLDLRDMLSRPAQSSTTSIAMRQHMPELKVARQHFPEPSDGRQHMSELRDPRQHMTEPRKHLPELNDVRPHMPEPNHFGILGRAPSTNFPGVLTHMDTLRNSYSPWTLERLRRRSPDGVVSISREFTPPRREEVLQRRPSVRPYDDIRVGSYMSRDVFEFSRPPNSASHPPTSSASRPPSSASYMTMAALPAGPAKPMPPPFAPPMPTGNLVQKTSYAIDDQPTVDGFLRSLGLEKYSINFKAEEVDMYSLTQMGDNDLKDLGIPLGPRQKIVLALQSRAKRQI